jgi:hypothetical protein
MTDKVKQEVDDGTSPEDEKEFAKKAKEAYDKRKKGGPPRMMCIKQPWPRRQKRMARIATGSGGEKKQEVKLEQDEELKTRKKQKSRIMVLLDKNKGWDEEAGTDQTGEGGFEREETKAEDRSMWQEDTFLWRLIERDRVMRSFLGNVNDDVQPIEDL